MSAPSRILHIAPLNTSGVPITFVRAERKAGLYSRLVTLAKDRRDYEEDLCLHLPFLDFGGTRWLKKLVSDPQRLQVRRERVQSSERPPVWRPHSNYENWLIRLRELLWGPRIRRLMAEIDFWSFDLYQLEGGLEFYRDGRLVKALKEKKKKIICLYTGSDLRTRGIIPAVDRHADLRLTLEFDHLELDPTLQHVFFPFEFENIAVVATENHGDIVIGHAPTNRQAKGSERILAAIDSLSAEFPLRLELIENLPHAEAMRRKASCDIFVDNLSELGYGVNSIEALALGKCTCTGLVAGFAARYPDHPFVEITFENIEEKLRQLCRDADLRNRLGREGRQWAEEKHGAQYVVAGIHRLLKP